MEDATLDPFLRWAESQLDARVTRCDRQGERRSGGRPAFFIDFENSSGEAARTYARMERGDGQLAGKTFGLEREFRILEALHEQGIRVPRVYGYCDAPGGILMENVAGEFDYTKLSPGPERDALDRDFLSDIVRLHAIDASVWTQIGLKAPSGDEETALADLGLWERTYGMALKQPVPLVEFATRWLRRNVPRAPERLALVQGDTGPGQFLFDGPRVTAIIDWEFAHIADPILDLAQIRTRDFYNPGGDMSAWMRTYAELAGEPIDLPKLRYYTVKSMLITPLALAGVVQHMVPQTDHAEWYSQDVTYKRATAEALSEALGVPLEAPPIPDEDAGESRFSREGREIVRLLEANLRDEHRPAAPDDYARYRIDLGLRLTAYLRNAMAIGAEMEAQEADERRALLAGVGRSGDDEAALLALIEDQDPRHDEAIVGYLYRRSVREEALWRGGLGVGEGAKLQPISL